MTIDHSAQSAEPPSAYRPVGPWIRFIIGAVLCNAVVTLHRWVPAANPALALVPSLEASVAILLAGIGLRPRRTVRVALSTFLGFLFVYSALEAFYIYYYDRHFAPWTDIPFLRGGVLLLFGQMPPTTLAAATVIAGIGIVGAAACGAYLVVRLLEHGTAVQGRIAVSTTLLVVAIGAAIGLPSVPLTRTVARGVSPPGISLSERLVDARTSIQRADFSTLDGIDLHLFFVESYGRAAFERPELRDGLSDTIDAAEAALRGSGYGVVSSYLESPVVGGYSWIAEAAFLTGRPIGNQADYAAAIDRGVETLPGMLRDAGYLTLLSMPGTVHGDWPEAKTFYEFEHVMLAPEYDYSGPMFSFVPITDQVAVAQAQRRLQRLRGDSSSPPAYVQHVLVSSHAPYNRIPPYIENWDSLEDGSQYSQDRVKTFDNDWLTGRQFVEGYIAALTYSVTVVTRFIADEADREILAILVDDHQPGPQLRPEGSTHAVPIHIVSRNNELLNGFLDEGYRIGMRPVGEPPFRNSYEFLDRFTRIVSGER